MATRSRPSRGNQKPRLKTTDPSLLPEPDFDERYVALSSVPVQLDDRCALCLNGLDRGHHAVYLAILEHPDFATGVGNTPTLRKAACRLMELSSSELHHRLIRTVRRRSEEMGER